MSVKETLKQLESEKTKVLMAELYGAEKAEENRARYRYVAERFEKTYGERDIKLFTSPGRTEISGNHTDHNHGKVLAGSINLDCVGAAGVSSSASYEMLICSMLNTMFNEGKMDVVTYAHIGKYAENKFWNKASGLLDQMACAVGGLITIDFKNPEAPVVEKIDFDFGAQDHSLMIVNTGKGHADLSADYSSVPNEMKKVAQYFGKEVCAEISEEEVIANLAKVRAFAGDRSVMRAFHFFEENKRVEQEVKALRENDFAAFLEGITASGNSSWKWLQNVYTTADVQEQGISIALALTELFIAKKGRGACRVHGGGFAGVIMAMIPNDLVDEYTEYIENAIGEGNVYRMSIRPHGAICVSERI